MNIRQAASASNLTVKTVRYYDEIGIVSAGRRANGYRDYSEDDVHKLKFLQRARGLGFSVEDCRQLLSLYEDQSRVSADVKAMALARIEDIDRKLAELTSLRSTLSRLADACKGDNRPDCPILNDLAGER